MNKLHTSLTNLLHQRTIESERVEYKVGWNSESIVHTLSAFANVFHNLGEDCVAEENGVLRRIIRDALNYIKA